MLKALKGIMRIKRVLGEIEKQMWLNSRAKIKGEMVIYESKGINHTALWLESLDLEETDCQRGRGRDNGIKKKKKKVLYFLLRKFSNNFLFKNELPLFLCISLSPVWVYSLCQRCTSNYQNNMHCSLFCYFFILPSLLFLFLLAVL